MIVAHRKRSDALERASKRQAVPFRIEKKKCSSNQYPPGGRRIHEGAHRPEREPTTVGCEVSVWSLRLTAVQHAERP